MKAQIQKTAGRIQKFSKKAQIVIASLALAVLGVAAFVVSRGGNEEDSFIARGAGDEMLAVDDANGSPHFALTSDFDPTENADATVPTDFREDADGILTVNSAQFVESDGPYVLDWKIKNGDSKISCLNCMLLDARLKKIISAVLASGSADGIEEIVGVEPARTLAGDYAGNGWQVEFVVGNSAKSQQAGEKISTWLLENSVDHKVISVLWQNLLFSSNECGKKLLDVSPVEAYPSAIPASSSAQRDAAMDRVIVASPTYIPQFEDRDGAQFLAGWKSSSC